jgi:hypothetical protein
LSYRKLATSLTLVMISVLSLLSAKTVASGSGGNKQSITTTTISLSSTRVISNSSLTRPVVSFSLSYIVSGGGNVSAPWFAYLSEGAAQNVTLSRSPQFYQVDGGSTWTVEATIPSQLAGERWSLVPQDSTGGTATANMTLIFEYVHQYRLDMMVEPTGSGITFPSREEWVNATGVVPIQASPSQGFMFDHWSCEGYGCVSGSQNPIIVTLNGPIVITAHFAQGAGVTILSSGGIGSLSVDNAPPIPLNESGYVPDWQVNSTHTVQALSSESCGFSFGSFDGCVYKFQEWLVNGTTPVSGDTYSFTVSGKPTTVTAVYRPDYTNLEFASILTIGIIAAAIYLRPGKRHSRRSTRKAKSGGPVEGEPLPKWCANCGAINPWDNAFCGKCGFNLDATRVYK